MKHISCALITSFLCASAFSHAAPERPNIILIMADDLGWGDVGFNGNKTIQTQHLDQMAMDGIKFDRFYSASTECSPTRASCLTGRNPVRTGVPYANSGFLYPEEITIPEILLEHGYNTGIFGKWHLGTLTHTEKDANRGRPGNTKHFNPPKQHGFEKVFVTESKIPTYDPMVFPVTFEKGENYRNGWLALEEREQSRPFGTYFWDENDQKVEDNLNGDASRIVMDRAIDFIDQAVEDKKPFFSAIWFHAPHLPCVASPKHQKMYADQPLQMQNYAGCITAMDEEIGRLRKHLEQLDIADNTMIWFCSDNGPEIGADGSSGPFRERKRFLYEGGVRIPAVMVWPNKVHQAQVSHFPAVTSDYLPTILDALQIQHPKPDYQLDGISLLPVLEKKIEKRARPIGFLYDKQQSYVANQYKLYMKIDGTTELYDINTDPSEKNNIAEQKPEIVSKIKNEFDQWNASVKDSYQGSEYGTSSLKRSGAKWPYYKN